MYQIIHIWLFFFKVLYEIHLVTWLKIERNRRQNRFNLVLCNLVLLPGFERHTLQEKVRTLQETCAELQERIHQMDSQISETKVCLDKEKAKYNNACRQQEVSLTEWKETFFQLLIEMILATCWFGWPFIHTRMSSTCH